MDEIKGFLRKNTFGRYELDNHEFSCGSSIQIYHKGSGYWLVGRVEYSNELGGYYFYSDYPDIPSFPLREGMKARVGFPKDHVAPWMVTEFFEDVRCNLIEALREKNKYSGRYKKEADEAYKSLGGFLEEIEKLPFYSGNEE